MRQWAVLCREHYCLIAHICQLTPPSWFYTLLIWLEGFHPTYSLLYRLKGEMQMLLGLYLILLYSIKYSMQILAGPYGPALPEAMWSWELAPWAHWDPGTLQTSSPPRHTGISCHTGAKELCQTVPHIASDRRDIKARWNEPIHHFICLPTNIFFNISDNYLPVTIIGYFIIGIIKLFNFDYIKM